MSDDEIEYRELMGDIRRDEREDGGRAIDWRGFFAEVFSAAEAVALLALLFVAVGAISRKGHSLHCEGESTGRCGWAWCEHYDGSDHLHDFNF